MKVKMEKSFRVEKHHRVKIPKGTIYRTTHPSKDGDQIAKRTYIVKANNVSCEYSENFTWPGSGGYWCWTSKENVELVEQ